MTGFGLYRFEELIFTDKPQVVRWYGRRCKQFSGVDAIHIEARVVGCSAAPFGFVQRSVTQPLVDDLLPLVGGGNVDQDP
jgi:hypothetical protein